MMFVCLTEVFFRFLVESLLATERAEVVSLAVVLGRAGGSRGINVHAADGIMYGRCHRLLLLFGLCNDYTPGRSARRRMKT